MSPSVSKSLFTFTVASSGSVQRASRLDEIREEAQKELNIIESYLNLVGLAIEAENWDQVKAFTSWSNRFRESSERSCMEEMYKGRNRKVFGRRHFS